MAMSWLLLAMAPLAAMATMAAMAAIDNKTKQNKQIPISNVMRVCKKNKITKNINIY